MKIAVATKNGIEVDTHFGTAEYFEVYQVTKHTAMKETRVVEPYADQRAQATKNHTFNEIRFERLKARISDCQKIVITKIGAAPAQKFMEAGIAPVQYEGNVLDYVRKIQKEEL